MSYLGIVMKWELMAIEVNLIYLPVWEDYQTGKLSWNCSFIQYLSSELFSNGSS
jgi:hypothetical protein